MKNGCEIDNSEDKDTFSETSDEEANYSWKCDICDKIFAFEIAYIKHSKSHKKVKVGNENIDDKNSKKDTKVLDDTQKIVPSGNENEKTHIPKKQYQCKICLKSLSSSAYMKEHEGIHTGEKRT